MKLPNSDQMVIERQKIVEYLLNSAHPDNRGKAGFFLDLGFTKSEWQRLAAALRKMAGNYPVSIKVASPHGTKYIVDGSIDTPCGKAPFVRTVWIVDIGFDAPRLVTVYPCEEQTMV